MSIETRLAGVSRVFLDTAVVIYYVQSHPLYRDLLAPLFRKLDDGSITAVISPVTLAECLVFPIRQSDEAGRRQFEEVLSEGQGVLFAPLDREAAVRAAELRAQLNMKLPDAIQVAIAELAACEAVVTNDDQFKRVLSLDVIVLKDLLPG